MALLSGGAWAQGSSGGAWDSATLYRDGYGVPHIYARAPDALAFAFGYAQAEDHLEPMLLAYRMAQGRLAEVLGEAEADSDAFARKLAHGRVAAEALDRADPITLALCAGFSAGVNAWMAEHPRRIPAHAEPVQPADVLALWHCFLLSFAPFDLGPVYRRPRAFESGVAWAAGSAKATEGKPILVVQTHGHFEGPWRWYEAHLAVGDYDVSGATLFGLPILLTGHNGAAGWALTPNQPDIADFFEERVQAGAQPKPWWRLNRDDSAELAQARQREVMLTYAASAQPYRVRTAGGFETREVPTLFSPLGPVFDRGLDALFSWGVGGYFELGGLRQLFEMGRARDLPSFQQALGARQLPCFHILHAAQDGSLFYLYNATIGSKLLHRPEDAPDPALEASIDWGAPIPAHVTVWDWQGPVPLEQLPHVLNPASGWLQLGGTPPWGVTDDTPIDAAAWPQWLVNDPDTPRAERLRTLLRGAPRTYEEHTQLLFDTIVPAAQHLAPRLVALGAAEAESVARSHPDLAEALALLAEWNHSATLDAAGMTFYHLWWSLLRARAQGTLPSEAALYAALAEGGAAVGLQALDAAADAARMMRNDLRGVERPWGEVHRIRRGDRDLPIAGAATGDPLFVASDHAYRDGRWYATYGLGYGLAVQFDEPARAMSLVPFGSSEHPASPHFSDQLDLMLAQRMKPAPHREPEVLREARSARGTDLLLRPGGVDGEARVRAAAPLTVRTGGGLAPPAPLPPRMAPFTTYFECTWPAGGPSAEVELQLHVPATRCPDRLLPQLAVFAMEEGLGWYRVSDQALDAATRTFRARNDAPAHYAVLGPEQLVPGADPEPTPVTGAAPQAEITP
jgi:acyl-homoserine lactone acylase PvdQ